MAEGPRELLAVGGPLHGKRITTSDPTSNRILVQENVETVMDVAGKSVLIGRFITYRLRRMQGLLVWECEIAKEAELVDALALDAGLKRW